MAEEVGVNSAHVAITGASSGIGNALARCFGGKGARLSLVARRRDPMEAIAKELDGKCQVYSADLSVLDSCCEWLGEAEKSLGPVDILINNAGLQYVEPAIGVSNERAENLINLNLLAPLRMMNHVIPSMLQRGKGCVVNVASVSAITYTPGMAHYSTAKSGIAAASETFHAELSESGVHIMTVYPGPVDTPMAEAALNQLESRGAANYIPTGTAEKLASLVVAGVTNKQRRIVYPAAYQLNRYFPNLTQWITERFAPPLTTKGEA